MKRKTYSTDKDMKSITENLTNVGIAVRKFFKNPCNDKIL